VKEKRKVVVLGASTRPGRASGKAVARLVEQGMDVVAIGIRAGDIAGIKILTGRPVLQDVETLTLYISPKNQPEWYDYILAMKPKRILFNPGTENPDLKTLAENGGIQCDDVCTLVLLSLRQF